MALRQGDSNYKYDEDCEAWLFSSMALVIWQSGHSESFMSISALHRGILRPLCRYHLHFFQSSRNGAHVGVLMFLPFNRSWYLLGLIFVVFFFWFRNVFLQFQVKEHSISPLRVYSTTVGSLVWKEDAIEYGCTEQEHYASWVRGCWSLFFFP